MVLIRVQTKQTRAKLKTNAQMTEKRLELEAKKLDLFKNIFPHRASMEVRRVPVAVNKGKLWQLGGDIQRFRQMATKDFYL